MKPIMHYGKYAALAVALVAAAACSKQDKAAEEAAAAKAAADSAAAAQAPAPPMPVELDACNLLTAAEAKAIVTKEVAAPARSESNPQVCEYKVEGGLAGTFTIQTQLVYSASAPEDRIAELKTSGVTPAEAPGIGDRSFFATQQKMTQLYTFKSGNEIIMTLGYMGTDAQQRKTAEQLMTKIISKL